MSDLSMPSPEAISKAIPSVISSSALEAGLKLSESPGIQAPPESGPVPAPVSRSRSRGGTKKQKTNGSSLA